VGSAAKEKNSSQATSDAEPTPAFSHPSEEGILFIIDLFNSFKNFLKCCFGLVYPRKLNILVFFVFKNTSKRPVLQLWI
jgi:hypothetical protein